MATKITAAMLIATALPISKAFGHTVDNTSAPVTGYLCVMLGIGNCLCPVFSAQDVP
jgi:hypothetical protein